MADTLTSDILRAILYDIEAVMQANAAYLNELDQAIGDGDHGRNMALGFTSVRQELQCAVVPLPGALLRSVGMTLVTVIGGASGPLYGAAFIAAGIVAGVRPALTLPDFATAVCTAGDAVARRGRCQLGDKTLYDALYPAAQALRVAAEQNCSLTEGLQAAAAAARQGMEQTRSLVARRGLALQYGAASVGHQDPGATSCYLIFDSALRIFQRYSAQ